MMLFSVQQTSQKRFVKHLPGQHSPLAPHVCLPLAHWAALGSSRAARGGPEEGTGEQGTPGGAPGSRGPEEAGEVIEGLVVHRSVLRNDAEWAKA